MCEFFTCPIEQKVSNTNEYMSTIFILEVQEQAEIQIDGDGNQNSDNLWRKGLVLMGRGKRA